MNDYRLLKLSQTGFYLLHHLGILFQLCLLFVDLCLRSLAYKFLIGQHAGYTGKLLGETLFLFLQALDFLRNVNQLANGM